LSVLSASFLRMSTRLSNIVVDAVDPPELARFWAELLDWRMARPGVVQAPPDDGCELDLVFVARGEPKARKNRVHLDLSSAAPDQQMVIVSRALALGASRADVGQRNVPWIVMADPEGNEFCVLEPRPEYAATGALAAVVMDAVDPAELARFWSAATGWPQVTASPKTVSLRAPHGRGPWLELVWTGEPHESPNRVWVDLRPGKDRAAEVAYLLELGARRVGAELADPEGNEFRILDGGT
jgi:hypothetical protein